MQNNKSIVDYYRARAAEYEQIYYRKVPQRLKEIEVNCQMVRNIARGKTVLDLACGTGYWTKVASTTAKEVVGSDISIEMISQAKLKSYDSPVSFVLADLYSLPFRAESFDLIILGFWLSHEPRQDFKRLFDSLAKPLNSNGQFWLIDNNPPAEGPHAESAGTDSFGNNLKHRRLSNGDEFVIIKNYFSKEELNEIFSKRFDIVELTHREYYWSALLEFK